ncbi:MAG: response regulator [Anaerolineae bacterium]|nr:response regulator [Anaerolineae bacterium]
MLKNVLVATHHTAFGELLRLSLEESSSYRVRIAQNTHEALSNIRKQAFDLAVIDHELPGEPLRVVVKSLREQTPLTKIVLIPPDNDPLHPLVTELGADGCLSRPFYLPSMLKMVQRLLEAPALTNVQPDALHPETTQLDLETKPWLTDSDLLAQRLSFFLRDSFAQAALVTQLDQLLVYIGSITPQDAQELCEILSRYWSKSETYDLARFVRLSSDNNEVLLYAKTIEPGLGLGLVHATRMPISKVRAEINRLAGALKVPPTGQMIYPPPAIEDILPPIPPEEQPSPQPGLQDQGMEQPTGEDDRDSLLDLEPPVEQGVDGDILEEALSAPAEAQTATPVESTALPAEESAPEYQPAGLQTPPEEALSLQILMQDNQAEAAPAAEEEPLSPSTERAWTPELKWQFESALPVQDEISGNGLKEQDQPISRHEEPPLQPETILVEENVPSEPDQEVLYPLPSNGDSDEAEILNLNELLAAMPSPDPEQALQKGASNHPATPALPLEELPVTFPWEEHETLPFESGHKSITRPMVPTDTVPSTPRPSKAASRNTEPTKVSPSFLDETHPSAGEHASSYLDPFPILPVQNDQYYTCLLLTRIPGNKLRGQLGKQLKEWLPEICSAFGWNLDGMAVRPEYIQWTIRLAPAISPANLVRIVRKSTSEKIFGQYPGMKPVDGSDDFWAPGYLIIRGSQPPTQKALFEFIQLTRKRQGYTAG